MVSKELELTKNPTFREGRGGSSFVPEEEYFSKAFALPNYLAGKNGDCIVVGQ